MSVAGFDPLLLRALISGLSLALIAAPLGSVIVWRRTAFFGDALAHAAVLGASLALILNISVAWGVLAIAVVIAMAMHVARPSGKLPEDALLGILAHGALAAGLVIAALFLPAGQDVMALLFGDILAVSPWQTWLVPLFVLLAMVLLAMVWRSLLMACVHEEMAIAEGFDPIRARLVHGLLLAVALALALPLVGALLFTALLVVPPAAARALARSPEGMVALSVLVGSFSVMLGLWGAWRWDAPPGPAIVLAALSLFAFFHMAARILGR